MKQIAIIHDSGYADIDKMMKSIDYISNYSNTFDGDFTLIIHEDSALLPIIAESGLPYESVKEFMEEPDVMIAFSTWDEGTFAKSSLMKQWMARKPVYAFQLARVAP